jgi:hypothetical protein
MDGFTNPDSKIRFRHDEMKAYFCLVERKHLTSKRYANLCTLDAMKTWHDLFL